MIRSFFTVFLLLVVFFAGMTFGIKREQSPPDFTSYISEEDSTEAAEIVGRELAQHNHEADHVVEVDGPSPSTEKTAAIFEAGVKGFYNFIVEMLYQLANLFF